MIADTTPDGRHVQTKDQPPPHPLHFLEGENKGIAGQCRVPMANSEFGERVGVRVSTSKDA